MQLTSENIPRCRKCEKKPALTIYEGIWLCGECFANFIEKQRQLKEKMILEE